MPVGTIIRIQSADLMQLENLLHRNHLPAQDCAEQAQHFCGVFDAETLIAAGGLEPAADFALLRSVVVDERFRGQGLARNISEYLINQARSEKRQAIYLLTETAADYFEKRGFGTIARDSVPPAISRTRQFTSLCPDSAICMKMVLRPS